MFKHNQYCLKGEIWEPIPKYEGLYEASSIGRIRSVDGKTTFTQRHGKRVWKGRILKNKTKIMKKEGYKVDLWLDGKPNHWLVARLVCMAFHGDVDHSLPVKEKLTVNHIDGDRSNNNQSNLEWLTLADNIRHGWATGLYSRSKTA